MPIHEWKPVDPEILDDFHHYAFVNQGGGSFAKARDPYPKLCC